MQLNRQESDINASSPYWLSIAICTRNREHDLVDCVRSVTDTLPSPHRGKVELVIIDDGDISRDVREEIGSACLSTNIRLRIAKKDTPGLYESRREAIQIAEGEIILFLDDDVLVMNHYFDHLADGFAKEKVVGFSGIDSMLPKASWRMLVYQLAFLHSSLRPGKLSVTAMNGSVSRWPAQTRIFTSEFLLGYNMAFRKSAVMQLPVSDTFRGYSLGEDVFISHLASRQGIIAINPDAKVIHKRSESARDPDFRTGLSWVRNHYFILTYFRRSLLRVILFTWSVIGLIVKDVYDIIFFCISGDARLRQSRLQELQGKMSGLWLLVQRKI